MDGGRVPPRLFPGSDRPITEAPLDEHVTPYHVHGLLGLIQPVLTVQPSIDVAV